MEQLPDGAHGGYLHADEDGMGVSLRRWRSRKMNAAWKVHRILQDGSTSVLLHSAAYGRYLAATNDAAPPDHIGLLVVLGEYDKVDADPISWKVVGSGDAGYVLLRTVNNRLLRANGRFGLWLGGVTVDDVDNQSTMMHWKVETIPTSPNPPALRRTPPPNNRRSFRGLFFLHEEPVQLQRTIRFVRADNHGNFPDVWGTFQFLGRSVFEPRGEVARRTGNVFLFFRILMCLQGGRYGRYTPLLVDLPRNEETVDIIVLVRGVRNFSPTPTPAALPLFLSGPFPSRRDAGGRSAGLTPPPASRFGSRSQTPWWVASAPPSSPPRKRWPAGFSPASTPAGLLPGPGVPMPRRRPKAPKPGSPSLGHFAKPVMGSADEWAFGWEPWTAPALEDLLPQLSCEEQVRLQNRLREHERVVKQWNKNSPPLFNEYTEGERDSFIIHHVRFALHHYNARHPGEEFDAVKPLMESCVRFKGQMWYHVNFWARCRKSKKIKRFFAEVHYRPPPSNIVPVPGAKKTLRSSSVCSDLPFPDPEAEKPSSSSSVCSDLPSPAPEPEKSSSSSSVSLDHLPFRVPVPIVEACIIIEEPLDRYRKSCAFCRGYMDILHPKGRKFVCGNDKDRIEQQLFPGMITGVKMPFTCCLDLPSPNSQDN